MAAARLASVVVNKASMAPELALLKRKSTRNMNLKKKKGGEGGGTVSNWGSGHVVTRHKQRCKGKCLVDIMEKRVGADD